MNLDNVNKTHCCVRNVHVLVSTEIREAVNSMGFMQEASFLCSVSGCFFATGY